MVRQGDPYRNTLTPVCRFVYPISIGCRCNSCETCAVTFAGWLECHLRLPCTSVCVCVCVVEKCHDKYKISSKKGDSNEQTGKHCSFHPSFLTYKYQIIIVHSIKSTTYRQQEMLNDGVKQCVRLRQMILNIYMYERSEKKSHRMTVEMMKIGIVCLFLSLPLSFFLARHHASNIECQIPNTYSMVCLVFCCIRVWHCESFAWHCMFEYKCRIMY